MRLIPALLCTGLLAASFVAHAKKEKAPQPKQFIDRSVIVYPNAVPGFVFAEKKYDPAQWTYGVSLRYGIAAAPDVRLDVFVYPIGRTPASRVLDEHIAVVQAAVKDAGERKVYASVVIDPPTTFDIGGVAPAAEEKAPAPVDESTQADKPKKGADPALEKFIQDTMAPKPIPGRKVAMSFDLEGRPQQSLGYVFNKQLFLFKIRITTDKARLSTETFNTIADDAARQIIPAITIHNEGKCGVMEIAVDEKKDDADAGARSLITEMVRVQSEGCAAALGKAKPPADTGQETIVYPADTWKSE